MIHGYASTDHPDPPDTAMFIYDPAAESYAGLTAIEIAKKELAAYREIGYAIYRERGRLLELKARMFDPGYSEYRVQTSDVDPTGSAYANYDEYEQDVYERIISRLLDEQDTIAFTINALEPPLDVILKIRYMTRAKNIRQCQKALNYEYTYLCRLHGQALAAYARFREFPEKK